MWTLLLLSDFARSDDDNHYYDEHLFDNILYNQEWSLLYHSLYLVDKKE